MEQSSRTSLLLLMPCCKRLSQAMPCCKRLSQAMRTSAFTSSTPAVQALTGDRVGPQTAFQLLDDMMRSGGGGKKAVQRRPTIVLVDEMDLLINRTQARHYASAAPRHS